MCSMPDIICFHCRDFISLLSDSEDEELQQALRESKEEYQNSCIGQQDGLSSSVK